MKINIILIFYIYTTLSIFKIDSGGVMWGKCGHQSGVGRKDYNKNPNEPHQNHNNHNNFDNFSLGPANSNAGRLYVYGFIGRSLSHGPQCLLSTDVKNPQDHLNNNL